MELAFVIAVGLGAAGWWFVSRSFRSDPSMKADADLTQLLEVHKGRLAAAAAQGSEQHELALQDVARITVEMKQRGLLRPDSFVDEPLLTRKLENMAQHRYARSVSEIQRLAVQAQPSALYQLATLMRVAGESEMALKYFRKAAKAGDAEGQFALALALLGAEDEQEADHAKAALVWLKLAADQGHGQARKALSGLMQSLPPITVQAAFRDARRRIEEQGPPSVSQPLEPRARAVTSPFSVLLSRSSRRKARE